MNQPTNDQRLHLTATPVVTLRSELSWEIELLESWQETGLLEDDTTILAQLRACKIFRDSDV